MPAEHSIQDLCRIYYRQNVPDSREDSVFEYDTFNYIYEWYQFDVNDMSSNQ